MARYHCLSTVFLVSFLSSLPAFGQVLETPEFRVTAGETYVVTPDRAAMHVDRWVMEHGSTIELAPDVPGWEIHAQVADIGDSVTIRAIGSDGSNGSPGNNGRGGSRCGTGGSGGRGTDGTDGSDGKRVTIVMGVRNVHGLLVDVRGGRGGDGGSGGSGGRGGRAACNECFNTCRGGSGGNGGAGGAAGSGGNGGAIDIRYWPINSEVDLNIVPQTDGGGPGTLGQAGGAGRAGAGINCDFPCPDRAGGQRPGGRGAPGQRGIPGIPGEFSLRLITPPASPGGGR